MLASPPAGAWCCVGEKARYKCQHGIHTRLSKNCHAFAEGLVSAAAGVGVTPPPEILRLWLVFLRSWFGAVGVHTARPETNQPVEPRQESAHGRLGKGSRVRTFSDGLLPAAQSCWGWWWGGGGGGCLLGNLEGTKNQIKRRLLPLYSLLGRLISVRSSLS